MADRAGNIAPESRTQGVILSETARRPSCGRRRLFRGKADRRNRCGTTWQAAPADMQAGIPRIQKPWSGPNGNGKRCGGGRRGTGDGQQTASAGRWTAQRATDNRRRGDGRRWTAGGRSKEWRKKNQTEYRRRRTDRQSWRAAGRESYRRRELRAERATGGESYGPARRKRKTGRKTEQRAMQRRQTGLQSQAAKKQACATAGPTTRPEGRHTIFISARPEYASQRRESSYRPA